MWLLLGVLLWPSFAGAQAPGTRAAGMGTAFVGVADDASAVYWNPAGVATGPFVTFQLDLTDLRVQPGETPAESTQPGVRDTTRLMALSVTPLGLSYYRLSRVQAGPAVTAGPGRQEGRVSARRLDTSQFGATLLQSVGDWVTVATTIKAVRGTVADGTVVGTDWAGAFDRVEALDGAKETHADLDVGVMVTAHRFHLGAVARNLRQPTFGDAAAGEPSMRLDREVRVGAAYGSGWPGQSALIVAVDADVTERVDPQGPRRDVAAGAEAWVLRHRVGLRAGIRGSALGARRTTTSAGVSVGITAGWFVDAQLTRGDDIDRGWGVGMRFVY